jgi:hypothetical protein
MIFWPTQALSKSVLDKTIQIQSFLGDKNKDGQIVQVMAVNT